MAFELTHAEEMLKAIEDRLLGRIRSDYQRYMDGGRSLDRIPVLELEQLRNKYRIEVDNIKRARGEKVRPRRIRFC